MTNIEGITNRLLLKNIPEQDIINHIVNEYRIFKDIPESELKKMAVAVIAECKNTQKSTHLIQENSNPIISSILKIPNANVTMGAGGVGCRGKGDFFVHSLLAKLSRTSVKPHISPESLDDTGAIVWDRDCVCDDEKNPSNDENNIILTNMEGMHSRLSDFPFLAGFHVTRAALRDVYVKGGIPLSIMVDVHLADDGDVGKLFDFQAGIAVVAELTDVPITAGSTLRIGGDMVIGDRLTGGIAAVGGLQYSFFRKNIEAGDVILMTEGAGGGTISTTALYSGEPETILKTLNIKFLKACQSLFKFPDVCKQIHAMADVTNGGLRGDLYEINHECGFGVNIYPENVRNLVDTDVLSLLDRNGVDYLGVSLDALLIYCKPAVKDEIIQILKNADVGVAEIGRVIEDQKVVFINDDGEETIQPRFRESAYTEIKKIVDGIPSNAEALEKQIKQSYIDAEKKKNDMIDFIQKNKLYFIA